MIVDVVGPVRRPGVVTLPAGSRVADAITAAGGLTRGSTAINLARVLVDGEQIDVAAKPGSSTGGSVQPGPGSSTPGGTGGLGSASKVNLNTASAAELEALPRVGPVMAQKIIDFRTANGGFRTVDQLREVGGIGDVTFAGLAPLVQV